MSTYKVGSTGIACACGLFDGDETWISQLSFMGDYLATNSGGCFMEVIVVK